MERASVLIVEDHPILGAGIEHLLRDSGWSVCARAANGADALRQAARHKPNLILLDLSLPDGRGEEFIPLLRDKAPESQVVVLTMHSDEESVMGSIRAGARGYALKSQSMSDAVDALMTVQQGGTYFSPVVSNIIMSNVARGPVQRPALSPAESRVLRMVAEGASTRTIARAMGFTEATARGVRASMMRKLGLTNAAEATREAIRLGLVAVPAAPDA